MTENGGIACALCTFPTMTEDGREGKEKTKTSLEFHLGSFCEVFIPLSGIFGLKVPIGSLPIFFSSSLFLLAFVWPAFFL